MVDAHDSKSCTARCESSSLSSGTKTVEPEACLLAITVFAEEGLESERGAPVEYDGSRRAGVRGEISRRRDFELLP